MPKSHFFQRKTIFSPKFLASLLGLLAIGMVAFSIFWLTRVYVPIIVVEAQYQYRQGLSTVFHTTSLRGVFIPEFRLDMRGMMAKSHTNGIYVPKIGIDAEIVYNVDPNDEKAYTEALKKGIAQASGTSLPDSGGLGYYFAHSSNPEFASRYNAIFYLLGKLEKGDEIFVWHQGKRFMYAVTKRTIVDPKDTQFLKDNYAKETVVFQTCWPPGTSLKRMLVFAERVE